MLFGNIDKYWDTKHFNIKSKWTHIVHEVVNAYNYAVIKGRHIKPDSLCDHVSQRTMGPACYC